MTAKIPERWQMTILSNVADLKGGIAKGKKRAKAEPVRLVLFLRVANVQAGFLKLDEIHSIEATEREIAKILLKPGDVLFNEGGDRDKLGRGWVWEGQIPECVHQNHVFRARPKKDVIDPYFLSYWGNSKAARDYFEEEGKQTVNLASISLAKLGGLPLPLPSLPEQRRIVAKLEALLAMVDTSRQRMDRVPILLKRFRQAVLAAAIDGRLTEDWRTGNPQKAWADTTLGDVAIEFRTGPFGSTLHQSDYIVDGVPVINPTNIVSGKLIPNPEVTVSAETFQRLSEYVLHSGDIIIARRGEMGRCAVVGSMENGWLCGTGSALIRVGRNALPEYIQALVSSPSVRQFLSEGAVGSTMANLNQTIFKSVPISLPSVSEQSEILQRVLSLNALADQIEARYTKAKAQVDRLTQSILSKAFRGELVPQDPNDERAEVMLAKLIAPPTETAPAKRRGRPRKADG